MLSLRHFRLARWCSLSLGGWSPKNPARRSSTCSGRLGGAAAAGRTMVRSPAAPDSFLVIFRFGADAGARAIGATDGAAAVELRGLRQQPDRNRTDWGSAACSLSDISGWRDGVLYPLAGGGRRIRRGAVRLRRRGAADLLGPALRTMVRSPAAPDFLFSDIPVRGDDGARAIGATDDAAAVELRGRRRRQPDRKPR